jgi:AmiR/NasT family two-component response regulator
VIADDEVLLRDGLDRLLTEAGFDVVGKAGTAGELHREVELATPDVVIIDIKMPPTHTDEGLVVTSSKNACPAWACWPMRSFGCTRVNA